MYVCMCVLSSSRCSNIGYLRLREAGGPVAVWRSEIPSSFGSCLLCHRSLLVRYLLSYKRGRKSKLPFLFKIGCVSFRGQLNNKLYDDTKWNEEPSIQWTKMRDILSDKTVAILYVSFHCWQFANHGDLLGTKVDSFPHFPKQHEIRYSSFEPAQWTTMSCSIVFAAERTPTLKLVRYTWGRRRDWLGF